MQIQAVFENGLYSPAGVAILLGGALILGVTALLLMTGGWARLRAGLPRKTWGAETHASETREGGSPQPDPERMTVGRTCSLERTCQPTSHAPLVIFVPAQPRRQVLMLQEFPPLKTPLDAALGDLQSLVRSADQESRRLEMDLEQAIAMGLAACSDFPAARVDVH